MPLTGVHLLFVIVIIIAIYVDTLGLPLALSLIASAFAVFLYTGVIRTRRSRAEGMEDAPEDAGDDTDAPVDTAAVADAITHENGPVPWYDQPPWQNQANLEDYATRTISHYALHTSYGSCYPTPAPVVGIVSGPEAAGTTPASLGGVDGALAHTAQKRAQRDKKCSDGWVLKDATYYAHHFDDELNISEAKPWWGRAEY